MASSEKESEHFFQTYFVRLSVPKLDKPNFCFSAGQFWLKHECLVSICRLEFIFFVTLTDYVAITLIKLRAISTKQYFS